MGPRFRGDDRTQVRAGNMSMTRRAFIAVSAAVSASLLVMLTGVENAPAQTYPARPVTLVVPLAPGGSTDVIGRIMAEGMRAVLGQPVIVENTAGAGGTIGVGRVARAAPDGYTMLIG